MKTPPSQVTNYIKHQECFYEIVRNIDSINATHIALYQAFFRYWNMYRFTNPIAISRDQLMELSGIKSKSVYYKVIRELEDFDLIKYYPSKSVYAKSYFCLSTFEFTEDQTFIIVWGLTNHDPLEGQQQIIFEETPPTSSPSELVNQSKLFNGKGYLKQIKKYSITPMIDRPLKASTTVLDSHSASSNKQPQYSTLESSIAKLSKSLNHAHSQSQQPRHSKLNPSGVQIDNAADYSIPL